MATRSQIARIEQRIEALAEQAAGRGGMRIIVVGPDETNEQALRRQGIASFAVSPSWIFVHTGVPRTW
jgi:hypothetical protein